MDGFRMRTSRSVNLGNGLRMNVGKNGVGLSISFGNGMRITRAANGKSRLTMSIPGTGMSYVKDLSEPSKTKPSQ